MKTIEELKKELESVYNISPCELRRNKDLKLNLVRNIMSDIKTIEEKACQDWGSVALSEIRELRKFIVVASASLSRLEAGARRRCAEHFK